MKQGTERDSASLVRRETVKTESSVTKPRVSRYTTATSPEINKSAAFIPNEHEVRVAKAAAQAARQSFMTCRRPGKAQRALDAMFHHRASLMAACGGAPHRFAKAWADVMEGK